MMETTHVNIMGKDDWELILLTPNYLIRHKIVTYHGNIMPSISLYSCKRYRSTEAFDFFRHRTMSEYVLSSFPFSNPIWHFDGPSSYTHNNQSTPAPSAPPGFSGPPPNQQLSYVQATKQGHATSSQRTNSIPHQCTPGLFIHYPTG